jgi:hypothetical protein
MPRTNEVNKKLETAGENKREPLPPRLLKLGFVSKSGAANPSQVPAIADETKPRKHSFVMRVGHFVWLFVCLIGGVSEAVFDPIFIQYTIIE